MCFFLAWRGHERIVTRGPSQKIAGRNQLVKGVKDNPRETVYLQHASYHCRVLVSYLAISCLLGGVWRAALSDLRCGIKWEFLLAREWESKVSIDGPEGPSLRTGRPSSAIIEDFRVDCLQATGTEPSYLSEVPNTPSPLVKRGCLS